jgi:hypothetical protein
MPNNLVAFLSKHVHITLEDRCVADDGDLIDAGNVCKVGVAQNNSFTFSDNHRFSIEPIELIGLFCKS